MAQALTHARAQRQIQPTTDPVSSGEPALLIQTPDGTKQWISWNQPTTIATPEGDYFVAFGPRLRELPFSVALEDFIVERNEGSDSVAMWTSKLHLQSPLGDDSAERNVWMNHPTWYQGWKIAQASWNPGDLTQSTLQVKREPMWVTGLTWSGACLVVSGIAVMFYGPRRRPSAEKYPSGLSFASLEEPKFVPPAAILVLAGKDD